MHEMCSRCCEGPRRWPCRCVCVLTDVLTSFIGRPELRSDGRRGQKGKEPVAQGLLRVARRVRGSGLREAASGPHGGDVSSLCGPREGQSSFLFSNFDLYRCSFGTMETAFIVHYVCSDFQNLISRGEHSFLLLKLESDRPLFILLCWSRPLRGIMVGQETWLRLVLWGGFSFSP